MLSFECFSVYVTRLSTVDYSAFHVITFADVKQSCVSCVFKVRGRVVGRSGMRRVYRRRRQTGNSHQLLIQSLFNSSFPLLPLALLGGPCANAMQDTRAEETFSACTLLLVSGARSSFAVRKRSHIKQNTFYECLQTTNKPRPRP